MCRIRVREYTSIHEAGKIRYQEGNCTDHDAYGGNDPIPPFFGKHDSVTDLHQ